MKACGISKKEYQLRHIERNEKKREHNTHAHIKQILSSSRAHTERSEFKYAIKQRWHHTSLSSSATISDYFTSLHTYGLTHTHTSTSQATNSNYKLLFSGIIFIYHIRCHNVTGYSIEQTLTSNYSHSFADNQHHNNFSSTTEKRNGTLFSEFLPRKIEIKYFSTHFRFYDCFGLRKNLRIYS